MLIEKLNNDIIQYISYYLNFTDISNLKQVNKEFKKIFNNNYFIIRAYQLYSKTFWDKAFSRNPIISKPLYSFQHELLRIENFNNKLNELEFKKWNEKDFYTYWETIEKNNNKKKINKTMLKDKIIQKFFQNKF